MNSNPFAAPTTKQREPAGVRFSDASIKIEIPSAPSPAESPSPPYLITRLSGITALPDSQLLTEFFLQDRRYLEENLFRILICAFAFCPIQPGEALSSAIFRHFSYAIHPRTELDRLGWLSQSKEALDELHRMLLAREGLLEQDQNGYIKLTPQLIETIHETLLKYEKNRHCQIYLNIAVLFEAFSKSEMNPNILAKAVEKIAELYNQLIYACLPEEVATGQSNHAERRNIWLKLSNPDDQLLKAFLIAYRISSRSSNVQRHPSLVLGNNPLEALIPEYRDNINKRQSPPIPPLDSLSRTINVERIPRSAKSQEQEEEKHDERKYFPAPAFAHRHDINRFSEIQPRAIRRGSVLDFFVSHNEDIRFSSQKILDIFICAIAFCRVPAGTKLSEAVWKHFDSYMHLNFKKNLDLYLEDSWIRKSAEVLDELQNLFKDLLILDHNSYVQLTSELIETAYVTLKQYNEVNGADLPSIFEAFSNLPKIDSETMKAFTERILLIYNQFARCMLPHAVAPGGSNYFLKNYFLKIYRPTSRENLLQSCIDEYEQSRILDVLTFRHPSDALNKDLTSVLAPGYQTEIVKRQQNWLCQALSAGNPDALVLSSALQVLKCLLFVLIESQKEELSLDLIKL